MYPSVDRENLERHVAQCMVFSVVLNGYWKYASTKNVFCWKAGWMGQSGASVMDRNYIYIYIDANAAYPM